MVSLSSAESEFYAIASGCARGLIVKHVLQEILHATTPDADVKMKVCTDSDAARGMIHRVGCGRVRHLQTRYLWHQQSLREGHFSVIRCGTKENPSDLVTQVLEKEAMTSCMSKLATVLAATLRGAVIAALARASGADSEVTTIDDGCWSRRDMNTTSAMVDTAGSVLTPMMMVAGRAVIVTVLVWRAAMSKYGVWSRRLRLSDKVRSRARETC